MIKRQFLCIILLMTCFISLGFNFGWDESAKPKKESSPSVQKKQKLSEDKAKESESKSGSQKKSTEKVATKSEQKDENAPSPDAAAPVAPQAALIGTLPVGQEIAKIQEDLQKIVQQTKTIQSQSEADRVKLQQVFDRVKIQKRLIDTLKVPPKPVSVKAIANTDEVVRQAKIQLIAEEVRKTQEALKNVKSVPKAAAAQPVQVVQTRR